MNKGTRLPVGADGERFRDRLEAVANESARGECPDPHDLPAPALEYLDVHLYGRPVGMVSIQTRIQDLVHPGDHDNLLDEAGHLFDVLFGALHDRFVMARNHQLGVQVLEQPLVESTIASFSPSAPVPCIGWFTFSMKLFTLLRRPVSVLAVSSPASKVAPSTRCHRRIAG